MSNILNIKDKDGNWIGVPAIQGKKGEDGFSPSVKVTQRTDGVNIAITDKDGTTNAKIIGTVNEDYQDLVNDMNTVKEDLDDLEDSVDDIADDVSALQTKESATERSIEMLWKLNKGQTYDIESQTESGTNDAPSGATYETLEEVYGKSSQQTTNVYQLLYFTRDAEITSSGLTVKTNVGESTISLNGESTATQYRSIELGNSIVLSAGSYVLSFDGNYTCALLEGNTYSVLGTRGSSPITFTITEDTPLWRFQFTQIEKTYNNEVIHVMLEKGSVKHDWEKYTGGIPQPNPSYPSEIVDVTEENFKVAKNENVNLENGYIDASGAFVPTQSDKLTPMFEPNGKVYIEWTNPTASKTVSVRVINYDDNKKFLSRIVKSVSIVKGVSGSEEITVSSKYVRVTYDTSMDVKMVYGTPQTRTMSYTLRGIGDYTDVMDVESGKIVRKVAEYVPTSSNRVLTTTTEIDGFTRYYFGTVFDTSGLSMSNSMFTHFSATANQMNKKYCGYTRVKNDNNVRFDVCAPTSLGESGIKAMFDGTFKVKYSLATPTEESISADDLAFLRGLENLSADHTITVTDQNGNDISYLVEYIIKLSEVV